MSDNPGGFLALAVLLWVGLFVLVIAVVVVLLMWVPIWLDDRRHRGRSAK